jgi:hypothetical protein
MKHIQSEYHSYLLRLWRVKEDGEGWRASLEDVATGEQLGFIDIAALLRYLEELGFTRQEDGMFATQASAEDLDDK